jgi:hypothetical protein
MRAQTSLPPLALQLALEFLQRSGASFLLGRLNERVGVAVAAPAAADRRLAFGAGAAAAAALDRALGGGGGGPVALPVADVLAGIARAADSAAASAPASSPLSDEAAREAAARLVAWGVPFAPLACFSGVADRASVPWPDYRASALGRALLSAAPATPYSPAPAAAPAAAHLAARGGALPTLRTALVADSADKSASSWPGVAGVFQSVFVIARYRHTWGTPI